jgi:DNA repair photolyase
MGLIKSKGNMYDWVTHTHSHLAGKCPHECSYCYVQAMAKHYPQMRTRYSGDIRMVKEELKVPYGKDKIIFVEHMNDMFAEHVPDGFIFDILQHCREWPGNVYVFQTKNPLRTRDFKAMFPKDRIIGTTIETNREIPGSKAPIPYKRFEAMVSIEGDKFVTIEPIMDFDVDVLAAWMKTIKPTFINIGADSKKSDLPEPSAEKILELVKRIQDARIEIRKKINLERLLDATEKQ